MMDFSMKAIGAMVLLSATLLQESASQLTDCAASSGTDFDYEVILGSDVEVRWSVDTTAETISFEVFSPAEAWLSVGFSLDGMMVGSDAVIGLPDDGTVSEYDMTGKELDFVTPYAEAEITDEAVTQDATGTTITFTRPLTPATTGKEVLSSTPGDETWLIYAFGADNILDYHGTGENRGSALLDLFCGDAVAATTSPAPATATTTPSAAATSVTATLSPLQEGDTTAPTPSGTISDGDREVTGTTAPTAMDGASDSPTTGDDSADNEGNFAFRVGGGSGVWVAVATVSAAVLGAAMSV